MNKTDQADSRRRELCKFGMALAAVSSVPNVFAQSDPASGYPSRPVRMVIPFSPGGGTDIVGRLMAQKLSVIWKQGVPVENKSGANGTIGATLVAQSPADGYSICMFTASHSVNVTLQGVKQPYNLLRDFAPIIHLAVQPYVLVVRPGLDVRSVGDLVAMAKANPGAINFGSSGVGGLVHLSAELFSSLANIKMTHIPFKGGALAMMDVVAGRVDMMFTSLNQSKSFIESGKLRLLAVTTAKRSPAVPDIPTMQEAGVKGYTVESWYGIAAPAGVPTPIIQKINGDLNRVLGFPDVRSRLAADGATPVGGTPAQFGEYLSAEVEKWRRTIKASDIPVG